MNAPRANPRRAAVVELRSYHGETLASWVTALSELGFASTVYLTSKLAAQQPLALAGKARCEVRLVEDVADLGSDLAKHDLVVWNTMPRAEEVDRWRGLAVPTLAVWHRWQGREVDGQRQFLAAPRREALVLSPHAARFAAANGLNAAWMLPTVWTGAEAAEQAEPAERSGFVVPGKVEFRRRNYGAMLQAVRALRRERRLSAGAVRFVGDASSLEGAWLRCLCRAPGIGGSASITKGGPLDFPTLRTELMRGRFGCPLIDRSRVSFAGYFASKSSASLPLCVGLGLVPVLHAELAELYGLGDVALVHREADDGVSLTAAMRAALDLAPANLAERVAGLRVIRERWWRESLEQLTAALERLGFQL